MSTENKAFLFKQGGILWILTDAIVNSRLLGQGFLALTLDIWGQIIPCGGRFPGHVAYLVASPVSRMTAPPGCSSQN